MKRKETFPEDKFPIKIDYRFIFYLPPVLMQIECENEIN